MFIGREKELASLNKMYNQNKFQLFVLYGRRRVGKTTLLNEFCKDKESVFYSAEQSNNKLNLEKFSQIVFDYYNETTLQPFSSWENALLYIDERQQAEPLIIVFDEFPYLVKKNRALLSEFQHLIDRKLKNGKLFIILCGSYMSFMEKDVLGSKSPLFGRRTAQLRLKSFDYITSIKLLDDFSNEDKIKLYGAFGGTPLYLEQINSNKSFEENIKNNFLQVTAYLYEEPLLLLRQEVQEVGIYSAIIEAIATGASKSNEISTRIGEENAKCIKYMNTLCELGILYKETPFGEKESSRKTIYSISDFMFRFWYRYVFGNRTLIETGAVDVLWEKKIENDYSNYMGKVFEEVCKEYLLRLNADGSLPILFTNIGRWWGTDSKKHKEVEIDLVANEKRNYLFCECKWKNELFDISDLKSLNEKTELFKNKYENKWTVLFSKSGFTDAVVKTAKAEGNILLVTLDDIVALE